MSIRQRHMAKMDDQEKIKFIEYSDKLNIKKYDFTPVEENYDVKYRFNNELYIGEIKVRESKDINFFQMYGPHLELTKITKMQEKREELAERGINVKMQYFNIASDGIQVYDLKEPWEYTFYWKLLPESSFNPKLIWKMVYDLTKPTLTIMK